MEHRITQYPLEQGALEIEYIEEFFGEYKRRKTASEIVGRLQNRDHLILMATASLPDDPTAFIDGCADAFDERGDAPPAAMAVESTTTG